MRSDLARAPVNLHAPQRSVLEDHKKSSSGSYTTVQRQPSAGRKPPQGKTLLPEFPRRDEGTGYRQPSTATASGSAGYAVGSASSSVYAGDHAKCARSSTSSGSYASGAAAGRSTSVPRPSSRTHSYSSQTSSSAVNGASSHAGTSSSGQGGVPPHHSPRGAPPRPTVTPGSILDSLKTPSVLSGERIASLAQRMNSSSGLDYTVLAGGSSTSSLRLKRQAGFIADPGTGAPGSPVSYMPHLPHSSSLPLSSCSGGGGGEQLRAVYVSGPAAGTSGGGGLGGLPSTPGVAGSQAVGPGAGGRRASTDRGMLERVVSRASSFSSSSQGVGGGAVYGAGGGGGSISGQAAPSAPPLPPAVSAAAAAVAATTCYDSPASQQQQQQSTFQPQRLAPGAVYASQYAYQYGNTASTVYIPYSSQQAASAPPAPYGSSGTQGPQGSGSSFSTGASTGYDRTSYAHYQSGGGSSSQSQHQPTSRSSAAAAAAGTRATRPASPPSAPPLVPTTTTATTLSPSPQQYHPTSVTSGPASTSGADYATGRLLQRTGSISSGTLARPVGHFSSSGASASASAPPLPPAGPSAVSSRLRVLTIATDDDNGSGSFADGGALSNGSNTSLRRFQEEPVPRWSGTGAPSPSGAGLAAGSAAGGGGSGTVSGYGHQHGSSNNTVSPKTAAAAAATSHLASAPLLSTAADSQAQHAYQQQQQNQQQQYHYPSQLQPQQHQQQPSYHPSQTPQQPQPQSQQAPTQHQHPQQQQQQYAAGSAPACAALDAGGSSYTSTTSSNGLKSSVAATGTGVSSASTSRTTSSISQRSVADTVSAGQQQQQPTSPRQAQHPHASSHHQQHQYQQGNGGGAVAAAGGVTAHAHGPGSGASAGTTSRHAATAAMPATRTASAISTSSHASSTATAATATIANTSSGGLSTGSNSSTSSSHDSDNLSPAAAARSAPSDSTALTPVCGPLPDLPVLIAPRDLQPGRGCVGLQNLGNTCFMNSILQSLNAVPELVQQFLAPGERAWSSRAVVAPAYSGLVRDMMSGSLGGCVNPSAFLRKVAKHDGRWGDGRQQDSQEFLNSLLEALQSECNRIPAKPVYRELPGKGSEEAQALEAFSYARTWNDSLVDDIFGGLMQSTIQCHACSRLSHTFEPFLGLALPIPATGSGDGGVTVADCLRAFVECEELEGDDSYKCEACKRRQPHSKRLQIFRPPRVLVLTLKRFSQRQTSPGFFSRFRSAAKNNTPVRLDPEPLDLTPYCNPLGLRGLSIRGRGAVAPLYQLVAVSHHSGSLEGGHYTAQARSPLDGHWCNFNDSSVRREPARPSGASSSAYVLFYRLATLPSSNL